MRKYKKTPFFVQKLGFCLDLNWKKIKNLKNKNRPTNFWVSWWFRRQKKKQTKLHKNLQVLVGFYFQIKKYFFSNVEKIEDRVCGKLTRKFSNFWLSDPLSKEIFTGNRVAFFLVFFTFFRSESDIFCDTRHFFDNCQFFQQKY